MFVWNINGGTADSRDAVYGVNRMPVYETYVTYVSPESPPMAMLSGSA